jgi:hypothetical protein
MKNLNDVIAAVLALQEQAQKQGEILGTLVLDSEANEAEFAELKAKVDGIKVRDRGPKSTRTMTRHDAWRVLHGDLKAKTPKEAAKITGLSYGQVYSARGEYTFKDVKADEFKVETPAVETPPAAAQG